MPPSVAEEPGGYPGDGDRVAGRVGRHVNPRGLGSSHAGPLSNFRRRADLLHVAD